MEKRKIWQIAIVVLIFWIADYILHTIGVGESHYYFISKFANAVLFSVLFFLAFNYKEHWKKIAYSIVFGTWISFYYLVSSYSGLVQWLGLYARYTPPPFEIFGIMMSPFWWWVVHGLGFYIGLEVAALLDKKR